MFAFLFNTELNWDSKLNNSPNSDNVVEYVWIGFKWWLPWQLYLIIRQLSGVEKLRRCSWSWYAGQRLSSNITQTGLLPISAETELSEWVFKKYSCTEQIQNSEGPEYMPEWKRIFPWNEKLVSRNHSVVCAYQSWWRHECHMGSTPVMQHH